jgi:hypothetical protein
MKNPSAWLSLDAGLSDPGDKKRNQPRQIAMFRIQDHIRLCGSEDILYPVLFPATLPEKPDCQGLVRGRCLLNDQRRCRDIHCSPSGQGQLVLVDRPRLLR